MYNHKYCIMYEVLAKLDKQNRVTIPSTVRELIGNPQPGDIIKVMVVGKVVPKTEDVKVGSQSHFEDALTA